LSAVGAATAVDSATPLSQAPLDRHRDLKHPALGNPAVPLAAAFRTQSPSPQLAAGPLARKVETERRIIALPAHQV
jgi:hypothetical protein